MCGTDCFLCLLSILFPPIGVWVKRGICSADSFINLALCCLGFLPGLLHAWYIILKYPDPYDYEPVGDRENATVTYYYVQQGPAPPRRPHHGYGTVSSQPAGGQFPGQQSGTVNSFAQMPKPQGQAPPSQQQQQQPQQPPQQPPQQAAGPSEAREDAPPTYADVIKGNHKVQSP